MFSGFCFLGGTWGIPSEGWINSWEQSWTAGSSSWEGYWGGAASDLLWTRKAVEDTQGPWIWPLGGWQTSPWLWVCFRIRETSILGNKALHPWPLPPLLTCLFSSSPVPAPFLSTYCCWTRYLLYFVYFSCARFLFSLECKAKIPRD